MKTFLATLVLLVIGITLFTTTAEARFRKPKYVCTGACAGGGNSVDIYHDNDADGNYDWCDHIDCNGKHTRENGEWPDVTENPLPGSGLELVDDGLNSNTNIYMWHAIYRAPNGAVLFSLAYDGTEGGDPI